MVRDRLVTSARAAWFGRKPTLADDVEHTLLGGGADARRIVEHARDRLIRTPASRATSRILGARTLSSSMSSHPASSVMCTFTSPMKPGAKTWSLRRFAHPISATWHVWPVSPTKRSRGCSTIRRVFVGPTKQRVLDVIGELGFGRTRPRALWSRAGPGPSACSPPRRRSTDPPPFTPSNGAGRSRLSRQRHEPGIQRPCGHPRRPATSDKVGHRGARRHRPQVTVLDAVKELAINVPLVTLDSTGPGCRAQPCGGPGRRRWR